MITTATWNINSVKARLDLALAWADRVRPDVLMLQEIKCVTENFPTQAFADIGYHAHVKGMPSYNGVAVLTREPATLIADVLPGDDTDVLARFQDVEYRGMRFINIYAPNGNPLGSEKFPYKLAWLDRLAAYVQPLLEQRIPFLIGGDFNIIPTDMDAKHPDQWIEDALFQPESQRKWQKLKNMGLIDAFRTLHPTTKEYSFWDYQAGAWQRNNGIRIDHFLLSPQMADHLESCTIDKEPRGLEKPSDHTPVLVTLKI